MVKLTDLACFFKTLLIRQKFWRRKCHLHLRYVGNDVGNDDDDNDDDDDDEAPIRLDGEIESTNSLFLSKMEF